MRSVSPLSSALPSAARESSIEISSGTCTNNPRSLAHSRAARGALARDSPRLPGRRAVGEGRGVSD